MIATSLTVGKATHIGQVRARNEDAYDLRQSDGDARGSLFLVADGMGGHSAGNVASHMAVEQVMAHYYGFPEENPSERLRQSVEEANRRIYDAAQSNMEYFRMGTTIVGAAILANRAHVANVGDSRLYLVRNGEIQQITRDHSWVALQVEMGELTPEEALVSQNRSVLLRCLGEKSDVLVDVVQLVLFPGDVLILCTDGLHGLVSADEIRDKVLAEQPQAACDQLVATANARGGHDNITVEIVRVDNCPPPAPGDEGGLAEGAAGGSESAEAAGDGAQSETMVASATAVGAMPARIIQVPPPATPPPVYVAPPAASAPAPAPSAPPPVPVARAQAAGSGPDALAQQMQWLSLLLAFLAGVIVALIATELLAEKPPDTPNAPPTVVPSPASTGGIPSPLPGGGSETGQPGVVGSVDPTPAPPLEEGVLMTRVLAIVRSLASDNTALYWLEGIGPTRLRRLVLSDAREPEEPPVLPGRYQSLAIQGQYVFVAADHKIVRYPRAGKAARPTAAAIPTRGGARHLCVGGDTLYWVEGGKRIMGASTVTLKAREVLLAPVDVEALAACGNQSLFWASRQGLHQLPLVPETSGEARHRRDDEPLIPGQVTHLAADARHLYWIEGGAGDTSEIRLRRADDRGADITSVALLRGPVLGLAVDDKNVFWVVSDSRNYAIRRMTLP